MALFNFGHFWQLLATFGHFWPLLAGRPAKTTFGRLFSNPGRRVVWFASESENRKPPVSYDLSAGIPILRLLSVFLCKSASSCFQQGEGSSRGLLHGCEIFANLRLQL